MINPFYIPSSLGITCPFTYKRMMKSTIIYSSQPRFVSVADINNDHLMDIVVANSGANTIGIFLSEGNETFTKQQTYPTGPRSTPRSIAIDDFNNDNYLDIAVANYGANNIGIFLGNGNGTFTDQKPFSLGSSRPLFITTGHFNNDNRTDILVANYGNNSVSILLGYNNGTFQHEVVYFIGYDSIPSSLVVADFNNDNQSDIAIANAGTNNIGILLGFGNGTFATQQTYTTLPKSNPSSIAVADFNHDYQLDIVVANNGTGNVGLLLGYGNGTFRAQTTFPIDSSSYLQHITVGHLNQDNDLDLIITDSINDRIHILLGYGNGTFGAITTYDAVFESSPSWAVVAQLNGNNRTDIVIANGGTNEILVLVDYSSKPSARSVNYPVGQPNTMGPIAASDFNRDNIPDLVFSSDGYIGILFGLDNGTFSKKPALLGDYQSASQCICVGDLNNDNISDIVRTHTDSDSVGVLLGYGNGSFAMTTNYSTGIGSKPYWITLGDINGDNRSDIVSANTGNNSFGILLGNGDGTFATVVTYSTTTATSPYAIALGDINNDNYLDLIVAGGNGRLVLFYGYGNGTFYRWRGYSMGGILYSIALGDFNSDKHLDFAVANKGLNDVWIVLGYENGMFTFQRYSVGSNSQPQSVIVADFNHDNISDIAATSFGNDEVVIFYGYGNGSFIFSREYSTGCGSKPYSLTTVDLDNNKHLELVVVLWGSGDIAVLTEYNAAQFTNQTTYPTGSALQPFSISVGDFNRDNQSDIVVANSGADSLSILFRSDSGTFDTEKIYPIGPNFSPQYVITCDFNRDNQMDIVSVNSKNNSISVITGEGNGTFAKQRVYSTGDNSNPYAVATGDLDNDNRMDFVVANEGSNSIGIFYGFNYTSFQSQWTYRSVDIIAPSGIVVGNFNYDNGLDIGVTYSTSNNICIFLGSGNGSFSNGTIYSTGNGSQPHGISTGDFNKDGRLDIVVANSGTNEVGVLLSYGNGSFASITTYSTGASSTPIAVVVDDFNNDSRLDLVVANYGNNSVGILLGHGNGSFSDVIIYSTGVGSTPRCVAVGDFTNDGSLDIAVTILNIDGVGIFLGNGNGTFRNLTIFPIGESSQPWWITVGDFNSDNQLDIAIAMSNNNNVGILLGCGNGTFAPLLTYSTGTGSLPKYVRVGDFNNDNKSDIAVANSGTSNTVVLFGIGNGSFLLEPINSVQVR